MKNRAKCKLCSSIIESYFKGDYVSCKCGEISVTDGDALNCAAKDFNNFLRVDDEGNEIIVTVKPHGESVKPLDKPTFEQMLEMLEVMGKNIERLPADAMFTPVNHYDLLSLILLLKELLRSTGTAAARSACIEES